MIHLITSDIHCTDQPRDAYRFGLFDWMNTQQKKHQVEATFILGDLTDLKDKHSANLVNAVIAGLKKLKPPVHIPMGNHDYFNPLMPYFHFLNHMNIHFYVDVTPIDHLKLVMIPHQLSQECLDEAFARVPAGWGIMCHQTFTGAHSESGTPLTGYTLPKNSARFILSGDVHAPQCVSTPNGDVIYCGSPYHVRFGDNFTPRVLLSEHEEYHDLYFPAPKKLHVTVRDVNELPNLTDGDQIKVDMELTREEAVEWENHKAAIYEKCHSMGADVYGATMLLPAGRAIDRSSATKVAAKSNTDYFAAFCGTEKVPSAIKTVGSNFL